MRKAIPKGQMASGKTRFRAHMAATLGVCMLLTGIVWMITGDWNWPLMIYFWFIAQYIENRYMMPMVGRFVDTYLPDHALSEHMRRNHADQKSNDAG